MKVKGRRFDGRRCERQEARIKKSETRSEEAKLWLSFARDCEYISAEDFNQQSDKWKEVGRMLHGLYASWRTFR